MALTWTFASPATPGIDDGAWVALAGHGPCDRFALVAGPTLFIHRKAPRGVRLLRSTPPRLPERLAAVHAALPTTLPAAAARLLGGSDLFLPFVYQSEVDDIGRLGFGTRRHGDVRALLRLWTTGEDPELVTVARGLERAASFCARYGTVLLLSSMDATS